MRYEFKMYALLTLRRAFFSAVFCVTSGGIRCAYYSPCRDLLEHSVSGRRALTPSQTLKLLKYNKNNARYKIASAVQNKMLPSSYRGLSNIVTTLGVCFWNDCVIRLFWFLSALLHFRQVSRCFRRFVFGCLEQIRAIRIDTFSSVLPWLFLRALNNSLFQMAFRSAV